MRRIIRWWRRTRRDEDDFADEVRAHLALEADRLVAEGWSPAAAASEARRRFGNVGATTEAFHDERNVRWIEDATRDTRFALRLLRKDRAYGIAAMAALALGIGANVTLFSIFSAVVMAPLPAAHPERVVSLSPSTRCFCTFSYGDYAYLRDNSRTMAQIAAQQPSHERLTRTTLGVGDDRPAEPVMALYVSGNYFTTYGIHAAIGRTIDAGDERAAAGPFAALISDAYWERRFQRNPAVLGSRARLGNLPVTIVGVTPRGFMGTRPEIPDFWITMAALGDVSRRANDHVTLCCEVTGRLADGATIEQATAELQMLSKRLLADEPPSRDQRTVVLRAAKPFGQYQHTARLMFIPMQVAMAMVLVIACANVAALLLGRAAARQREIAVRITLGAGRRRLIRQMLTEGVILALFAGAAALAVTWVGLTAGARYAAALLSQQGGGSVFVSLTPGSALVAYVMVTSIAAGLLFALAPALQATRRDVSDALRDGAAGTGMSRGSRLRGGLIAGQVAVCMALLVDAGFLSMASVRVLRTDPGFAHANVLSTWIIDPTEVGYDSARADAIVRRLEDRVRRLPGVRHVAVTSRVPLGGNVASSVAAAAPDPAADAPRFPYEYVSEDYFAALALRMRGRSFTPSEVALHANVVVISDSLGKTLWPGQNPIGRQLYLGSSADAQRRSFAAPLSGSAQVIGVVNDVRGLALTAPGSGEFYLPGRTNVWSSRLVASVSGDSRGVQRAIELAAHEIAPTVPVSVESLDDVIAADAAHVMSEVGAVVLGIVGLLGLLLAAVGIYGTIAYSVRQQRREIGIRMALGARPAHVISRLMTGTARCVAIGGAVGAMLGVAGVKALEATLYQIPIGRILDPLVMLGVLAGVCGLAVLAAFASARRATKLNPADVLQAA